MKYLEDGKYFFHTDSDQLIYKNCYLYDIKSCNIRIIKNLGFGHVYDKLINMEKLERNIRLGYLSKTYNNLIKTVDYLTNKIIKKFIYDNNITDDDIIFIQKDGLLIKKFVRTKDTKDPIIPELRNIFSYVIFDEEKKAYLAKDEENRRMITKGIRDKSIGLDDFLTKHLYKHNMDDFININNMICEFFGSNDKNLFTIPDRENPNNYKLILKDGELSISKDIFEISDFDFSEIDIDYYFETYISGFVKSILMNVL